MMAFKTVPASRKVQTFVHVILHLIAVCLGIVGICAAFRYHDMINAEDMYSFHSWIGIGTISLFCLQLLLGLSASIVRRSTSTEARARMVPWQVNGGRALLYMAVSAALTGFTEKSADLKHHFEARLINFTALSILLFGIFVDLTVVLARM
ncbi:transmembrane ascorbate ferrireductase 1-like [Melia azedarach]|uniref:Transmembrane ascorbate ferrireductase 1-like n=1 Tax=Melia azedarach TaxID=155640 RepID=A0ACC1XGB0_MELAZ|nr:transmembrane ascorbate ferrireductase 1-like [Melia azedarach]